VLPHAEAALHRGKVGDEHVQYPDWYSYKARMKLERRKEKEKNAAHRKLGQQPNTKQLSLPRRFC
jgi:hypothetical protein